MHIGFRESSRAPWIRRFCKIAAVCILSASAVVSVGHLVAQSYKNNQFDNARWGLDFHQFWYGGRLLQHGKDPYMWRNLQQPLEDTQEDYPKAVRDPEHQIQWRVKVVPASAPMLLLMAPLSFLPWVKANLTWFLLNIAFATLFVWIILRCAGKKSASLDGLLLFSLFFSLIYTRQVFELGQTSLMAAAFMWLSFAAMPRSQTLSGILLGVAVSKFTVVLPMVFYFAYKRKIKALIWCCLTQLAGLLILCALTETSPLALAQQYLRVSSIVLDTTGSYAVHLGAMPWGAFSSLLEWVVIAVTLFVAFWACLREVPAHLERSAALTLISIFSFWSLLALYHGRHDMVITLPFIAIALFLYDARDSSGKYYFSISGSERPLIYAAFALIFFVWIFPVYWATGPDLYRSLYTGCTLAAFAVSLRLFYCLQKSFTPKEAGRGLFGKSGHVLSRK
jgi:hypothetical protein